MPFYEYQCRACGELTEVLQKVSDPPLRKCPACGKSQLVKLVSAPVFRLKGSGWYETDFKSDADRKRNLVGEDKDDAKPAAEKEPAKEAPKETGDKADAKPAKEATKPKAKPVAKSKAKAKASKGAAGKRR